MIVTPDPTHPSGINTTLSQQEMDDGYTVIYETGPVAGTVSLKDGSVYDVTHPRIAVKPEHVEELSYVIHRFHHAAGRFMDAPLPNPPKS